MTVKLSKTVIAGFDQQGNEDIGVNSNFKMTLGYDTGNINIKIEKIIREDLVREHKDETVTYETVFEKTLTSVNFPKNVDHKAWYVEYDVIKNNINILDVLEFGAANRHKTKNYHATALHQTIKLRYNIN